MELVQGEAQLLVRIELALGCHRAGVRGLATLYLRHAVPLRPPPESFSRVWTLSWKISGASLSNVATW